MKADSINSMDGDLTGYDCKKCRNRGYVAIPAESGNIRTVECGCMKLRRCVWKMERSGLKNVISELTFETFTASQPWQTRIKSGAMEYAKNPQGWLLLCGQSGSGKSHLCTAVCRELLLHGHEVVYMPWRDDSAALKAMALDAPLRQKTMDALKKAEVLYIDDLFKTGKASDGAGNPTSADVSLAFEILNCRYVSRAPTILSTEMMPDELVRLDEAVGGRIIELAGSHAYSVGRSTARNYRLRNIVSV